MSKNSTHSRLEALKGWFEQLYANKNFYTTKKYPKVKPKDRD